MGHVRGMGRHGMQRGRETPVSCLGRGGLSHLCLLLNETSASTHDPAAGWRGFLSLMVRYVGVSQGLLRQKQFRFTLLFFTFTFMNNTISTLSVWQALR